ncbi:MAG: glycosyltransferase [Rhizobiales bacterium]|nr:glycosyltransferase [Hyphomicrobiales bacterium]
MKILFVHNSFPAQFQPLARALAGDSGVAMAAIGAPNARAMKGVRLIRYRMPESDVSGTHPFARRFDMECRRAEQVLYALSTLKTSGFSPDVILAHPGWGETLPLRTVFPDARILLYCEFFYGAEGRDMGFDPEFPEGGLDGGIALQLKNATTLLALSDADRGVSPTPWQRSTFPRHFQRMIEVVHEGIDVGEVAPRREAGFALPDGRVLRPGDPVITFVARNLEPLRGYHAFMRTLPSILERLPMAQVLIVGGHGTSYGVKPPNGRTWKAMFLDEVAGRIDLSRVHFTGRLPRDRYLSALHVSAAHVYLTYPFVLSWSLIEAMGAGCAIVASDTAPLHDVIDGSNGILVPFFDTEALADRVVDVVSKPRRHAEMRRRARELVADRYDGARVCVPQMRRLIEGMMC